MAWTTPSVRSTGDLITASIWNTDLKDNLRYLKGMDGQVTLEDDIIPNSSALTVGESANPWGAGHFYALYAGPRFTVHKSIREIVQVWEADAQVDWQAGGGGNHADGGSGQEVLYVDDDVNGSNCSANLETEQNNAFATAMAISRNPYLRAEFVIDSIKACQQIFIGFRESSSNSPPGTSENHAGLYLDNSTWFGESCNGSTATTDPAGTIAGGQRHVVEVFVVSGSIVEVWVDGSLVCEITGNLPTGNVIWVAMLYSEGTGGVGEHSYMTLGEVIAQEDLS